MQARIHCITLGVDDLERSLRFYRDGLGFETPGIIGTEWPGDETSPGGATVQFTLADGLMLALYERTNVAKDAHVPLSAVAGAGATLCHFVEQQDEVDQILALAQKAGAMIPAAPHERPWGIYSGHFADPDGYLWEIIYFDAGAS